MPSDDGNIYQDIQSSIYDCMLEPKDSQVDLTLYLDCGFLHKDATTNDSKLNDLAGPLFELLSEYTQDAAVFDSKFSSVKCSHGRMAQDAIFYRYSFPASMRSQVERIAFLINQQVEDTHPRYRKGAKEPAEKFLDTLVSSASGDLHMDASRTPQNTPALDNGVNTLCEAAKIWYFHNWEKDNGSPFITPEILTTEKQRILDALKELRVLCGHDGPLPQVDKCLQGLEKLMAMPGWVQAYFSEKKPFADRAPRGAGTPDRNKPFATWIAEICSFDVGGKRFIDFLAGGKFGFVQQSAEELRQALSALQRPSTGLDDIYDNHNKLTFREIVTEGGDRLGALANLNAMNTDELKVAKRRPKMELEAEIKASQTIDTGLAALQKKYADFIASLPAKRTSGKTK